MIRRISTVLVAIAISACTAAAPYPARAAYETPATAAYLYDVSTDTVLYEKNADTPLPHLDLGVSFLTDGNQVGVEGDLLILGFVNAGWGDQAAPRHRYFAFDKRTGKFIVV